MKPLTSEQISKVVRLGNPLKWMKITQLFGVNGVNFYKKLGLDGHDGLDLRAKKPVKCFAVCDGVIVGAGTDNSGGKYVKIESNQFTVNGKVIKLRILYYHLSKVKVKIGKKVKKGKVVGLTGNTGRYTTGPHLHFAIRVYYLDKGSWQADWTNGFKGRIDPLPFLPGENLPVDEYYGKKRNWILEYTFRFANTPLGVLVTPFLKARIEAARYVHKRLEQEGRKPPILTDREANAIIYGSWDLNDVLDETMYMSWSEMTKMEHKDKLPN